MGMSVLIKLMACADGSKKTGGGLMGKVLHHHEKAPQGSHADSVQQPEKPAAGVQKPDQS